MPRQVGSPSVRTIAVVLATLQWHCGGAASTSTCETDGECRDTEDSSSDGTAGEPTSATNDPTSNPTSESSTSTTDATGGSETSASTDGSTTTGVDPAIWWDCAWSHRTSLFVLGPAGDEILEEFPVPVSPSSAWFDFDAADAEGVDLRFVSEAGDVLPHEIESWNAGVGHVVWIRVPIIRPHGQATRVDLYYGNGAATDAQAPEDVWVAYTRVWHLGASMIDSAAGSSLAGMATPTEGRIGWAVSFEDPDEVLFESPPGLAASLFQDGATLSAWIRPSGWGEAGLGRVVELASGLQGAGGWAWFLSQPDAGIAFVRGHADNEGAWVYPGSVSLDVWTHVTLSYDDAESTSAPVAYANGKVVPTTQVETPQGALQSDATEPFTIGRGSFDGAARNFTGAVDELRVRGVISSERWIVAEHASMRGEMVVAGAVETAPEACTP